LKRILVSATYLPIPIFLGYCAKQIWVPTAEWGGAWGGHIGEIASVSGCFSSYPPNWIDRWDFNRSTCWNDEAAALAAVPPASLADFRLFCYRLIPILFGVSGDAATVSVDDLFPAGLPGLPSEPDLSSYRSVGYDIVEAPLTLSVFGLRLLTPVMQRDGGGDPRQSVLSSGRPRHRSCDREALWRGAARAGSLPYYRSTEIITAFPSFSALPLQPSTSHISRSRPSPAIFWA
jgi:hypothetical protein